MMIRKSGVLAFAVLFLLLNNCFEFSSLQSAKLLARNEVTIMPEYSSVMYTHTGDFKSVSNSIGFQCGYGLTNSFNGYVTYARLEIPEYNVGYNYFCMEPKFGLIKNSMAFSLPICAYFGENVGFLESVNSEPTLYCTYSVNNVFDITVAPKTVVFFPSFKTILAINFNTGIHLFSNKVLLVPEMGYGFNPTGKDQFIIGNFGVGFKYSFSK